MWFLKGSGDWKLPELRIRFALGRGFTLSGGAMPAVGVGTGAQRIWRELEQLCGRFGLTLGMRGLKGLH